MNCSFTIKEMKNREKINNNKKQDKIKNNNNNYSYSQISNYLYNYHLLHLLNQVLKVTLQLWTQLKLMLMMILV